MKYFKKLTAVTMAVVAVAAVAGAATASATVLYSGATKLGAGTVIKGSLTGTTAFTTTEGTGLGTCTGGAIAGTTLNAGKAGERVAMSVKAQDLTWTTGCTVTIDTIKGGKLEFEAGLLGNATVTASEIEVTVNTVLYGTCVFSLAGDWGTLTGSTTANAEIDVNAAITRISGLCPATEKWTGKYIITSPSPLHATSS